MKKGCKKAFYNKSEFQEKLRKMNPYASALSAHGISLDALARQIGEEMRATEVKAFKSRGEPVEYSKPLRAWNIQQRAREDAQKLLGLYPAEEHKITADISEKMSDEDKEMLQAVAQEIAEKVRRKKINDK